MEAMVLHIFADAASDYLQTSAEKTEWAMRGAVNERSFDNYNATMKRMWSSQKRIIDLNTTEDEITRGNRLYATCQGDALNIQMDGKDLPGFFGSGSLQVLANGLDKSAIGWHPRYKDLLTSKDGDDNEHS